MKEGQLSLFDTSAPADDISEPEKAEGDWIMDQLELLTKSAEASNRLLKSMIDRLQEGWTDDEKLQMNDPKEWARRQKEQEQQKPIEMPDFSQEAIETLKASKVEGNIVKLPPDQLDRKTYLEVKGKLELIGGKWKGGRVQGFVFQEDPSGLLEQIANREKRNLKKEFQFFGTPDHLADRLVELAEIGGGTILEPSAGQGAIVKAIHREGRFRKIYGFELMPLNQAILQKIDGFELLGSDFLTECNRQFDRIIANPPFAKNQDIDHILKMYECLAPGGRLVSIAGIHWRHSNNKKEKTFREWLEDVNAEIEDVAAGEFKESGTTVATVIITIDKL